MTKNNQLREAIIKAVPTNISIMCEKCGGELDTTGSYRNLTLADVLRAIEKNLSNNEVIILKIRKGKGILCFDNETRSIRVFWDLEKDYDNQPQKTKDFLYNLLVEHE